MERSTQLRILREMIRQMDDDRNADGGHIAVNPATAYTDPEVAAAEWKTLFRGHPQLVGLSGDLPVPNAFLTTHSFGVPVLATRDSSGRFRAFVNACRHRGTMVETQERGVARRFVCPFHHWSYNPSGDLVSVTRQDDFGSFDPSCRGLIPLPAEEQYGMLFVHPEPTGKIDVDDLLGGMAPEIESWHLGDLHFTGQTQLTNRLNWKLAIDTFGETYHLTRLHGGSLGRQALGDVSHFEPFGRNHRFCAGMRAIRKLPARPESEWRFGHGVNLLYFLFPNVHLNVLNGEFALIKIYPEGPNPGSTRTVVSQYVNERGRQRDERIRERHGDAVKLPSERVRATLVDVIEAEDYGVCETTQAALESGLVSEVLFGRNEAALHHYHNVFRDALGQPPLNALSVAPDGTLTVPDLGESSARGVAGGE